MKHPSFMNQEVTIEQKHQIKNHHYYNDNFNIWNNVYQASPKTMQFYHSNQRLQMKQIKVMEDEQTAMQQQSEKQRRQNLSRERANNLSLLQNRKSERIALQIHSNQIEDVSADVNSLSFSRNLSNPTLTGRANSIWNKLNAQVPKYIVQVCTPTVMKMESQGMKLIDHRIQQEASQEEFYKDQIQQRSTYLRDLFRQQHERNFEKEVNAGLVSEAKPKVIKITLKRPQHTMDSRNPPSRANTTQTARRNLDKLEQPPMSSNIIIKRMSFSEMQILNPGNIELLSNQQTNLGNLDVTQQMQRGTQSSHNTRDIPNIGFKQKFVEVSSFVDAQARCNSQRTQMLAVPKAFKFTTLKDPQDRTDYKGLLQIDFSKQIRCKKIHTPTMDKLIVKQSLATEQKINQNSNQNSILQEIDHFEKNFIPQHKRVGFPKVTLNNLNLD